ncbi:unnamed protein product [Amoebophrya sp. A25]|nr:unnamed protein product [Amoebophrya sp. A25]|eukprot:GSA25T00023075001.1
MNYKDNTRITKKMKNFLAQSFSISYAILRVALILGYCRVMNVYEPSYPRDENASVPHFLAGVGIILLLAVWSFTPSNGQNMSLPRDQTDEWKGWMQMVFILYHYYRARFVYNWMRVFVSSYMFLTGYGNFLFFQKTKDFSLKRVANVLLRLSFFPVLLSLLVANEVGLGEGGHEERGTLRGREGGQSALLKDFRLAETTDVWTFFTPLQATPMMQNLEDGMALYYVVPLHIYGFLQTYVVCYLVFRLLPLLKQMCSSRRSAQAEGEEPPRLLGEVQRLDQQMACIQEDSETEIRARDQVFASKVTEVVPCSTTKEVTEVLCGTAIVLVATAYTFGDLSGLLEKVRGLKLGQKGGTDFNYFTADATKIGVATTTGTSTTSTITLTPAQREKQFRLSLDRYSALSGIVVAALQQRFTERRMPNMKIFEAVFGSRGTCWTCFCCALVGSMLLATWYGVWGCIAEKRDYNKLHAVGVFFPPILGYLLLRNATVKLRSGHSAILAKIGQASLEFYVLQFHVLMSRNVQHIPALLSSPLLNAVVTGGIMLVLAMHLRSATAEIVSGLLRLW